MDKVDYVKQNRTLYSPKDTPQLVDVPRLAFLSAAGTGDPNTAGGEYQRAVQALFSVAWTIKMSKNGNFTPDSYFEYAMPPLEGLWWVNDGGDYENEKDKSKFCWTSLIRQPEFVTREVLEWAKTAAMQKKPDTDTSRVALIEYDEGLCVQCMHHGVFDDEPATTAKIRAFMEQNGLVSDVDGVGPDKTPRRHHELYLSNPNKTPPEKRKTILRLPVK